MTDSNDDEFERDLHLDPGQLDVECLRQGEVFYKWAQRLVEAKAEVDRLDLSQEVTEAQLQAKVRKAPAVYGVEKETEASFKAAVTQHPTLIKAKTAFLEAKATATLLEKAVAALEMKKRMLESLIDLHGQQYFGGVETPRNLVGAWKKFQKDSPTVAKQKKLTRKREIQG